MNCPVCKTTVLQMTEREGVEIDYCPQCRGIWLDRGELDKIIARSDDDDDDDDRRRHQPLQSPPPPQHPQQYPQQQYPNQPYPYKKKKSIWREMFDFD